MLSCCCECYFFVGSFTFVSDTSYVVSVVVLWGVVSADVVVMGGVVELGSFVAGVVLWGAVSAAVVVLVK